ncbi:MAG: division/cell wall cluster transcriptional repressor MraZ [Syntrophobacterales bacterium]|jgi:MraZ protein|nr:division/cell wall cluster transcriptional repressor MraZ [Syntrophobacterales bacterium]
MFSGRYDYSIDDKSRVSIPSKFREILSSNYDMRLVLTNLETCIVAYPYREWESVQQRISNNPSPSQEHRNFLRFFFSGVFECPIDKLGRILIPQSLKSYAGIRKDVTIAGMTSKIEIWAHEKFEEQMEKVMSNPLQMGQIISDFGL